MNLNNLNINPETDALLVIDVQNDFCPGGALAVEGGDEILPGTLELAKQFKHVVLTQDWHPEGHASFASTHEAEPYSSTQMEYGEQTLWPDHCVQGTPGAEFHRELEPVVNRAAAIIRKGANPAIDSYSAFFENDQKTPTGLAGYLRDLGVKRVFCLGLAYDYCVAYSALDARKEGFEAVAIKDLSRSIALPLGEGKTTVSLAEEKFEKLGVSVVSALAPSPRPSAAF